MSNCPDAPAYDLVGRLRQWAVGAQVVMDAERGYDRRDDEAKAAAEIERFQAKKAAFNDEYSTLLGTETAVLRALCGAVEDLERAIKATHNGCLSDHLENALSEIRTAMRMAIGGDRE